MRDDNSYMKYILGHVFKTSLPMVLVLLGMLLTITSSFYFKSWAMSVLASIGAALIVAGIVSFLYNYWLSRQFEVLRSDQRMLRMSIVDSVEALRSTSSSGVERVYENQSKVLVDYASIIKQTKYHVDILGITLISFLWSPDFESSTINALNKGVKFRVLILNPTSGTIKFLSGQEKRAVESFNAELKRSIQGWQELQNKAPSKGAIEIRTYDDVTSSFLMITDDRLFFAPYLHSVSILASPCFEVKAKAGTIYQAYKYHFETMWMQSSMIGRSE